MPKVKSIEQLRRELEEKEQFLTKLETYREKLQTQLDGVDKLIAQMTGRAPAGRRGRKGRAAKKTLLVRKTRKTWRRGGKSLVDFVKQVLTGKAEGMRVRDIMAAVKKAGYKTISKDFYTIVAASVRDPKVFTKLERGVYKLA